MEYDIVVKPLREINFSPQTVEEEVLQNLQTILTTPKYSVPLDRKMGPSMTWLDAPMPVAQAKITAEIVQLIREKEPRAKVLQVSFINDDQEGILRPKVRVGINE